MTRRGVAMEGFNPCFSGMAFGTDGDGVTAAVIDEFQSLFFWNGLWDNGFDHGLRPPQIVSILVFLEWPLGRCWTARTEACGTGVSILVFLEWPLGPPAQIT